MAIHLHRVVGAGGIGCNLVEQYFDNLAIFPDNERCVGRFGNLSCCPCGALQGLFHTAQISVFYFALFHHLSPSAISTGSVPELS